MQDIVTIGDTVVDEFITLKEAHVSCGLNPEDCTISMKWGDKIPYESSCIIPAVGNSANAAVAFARLGLQTGFVSNVGNDAFGRQILEVFEREGVATDRITVHDAIHTNHHYVLMYGAERTILIRHEAYPYTLPDLGNPRWIYLSSLAAHTEAYHDALAAWLKAHPETRLAFQPGTFQMDMGKERLAELYRATSFFACNKEEAERILGVGATEIRDLLIAMRALGPQTVLITDGPNGAYAFDGTEMLQLPMYPDPSPPVSRTGAGDATTSSIVAALALGCPLREALLWGPVNAMSVVQQVGAQKGLLSRTELEKYLAAAPSKYCVTTY